MTTIAASVAAEAAALTSRPDRAVHDALLRPLSNGPGEIELVQLQAVRRITVPGRTFAISVQRLLAELKSSFAGSTEYPIRRFFDILPLRLIDGGVGERLVARGNLTFRNGTVSNSGDFVEAGFSDQNLGLLSIGFDEELFARVTEPTSSELLFDFGERPPVVLLQGANRQFQVDSNQRVRTIRLGPTRAVYQMVSASRTPGQQLEITVDLTRGEEAFRRESRPVQIAGLAWPPPALMLLASGGVLCRCTCCGEDICSPPCPSEGTPTSPPFADLRPDCLWRQGSRITARFKSNVLGFTPDHNPSNLYIGRTLLFRVIALNCGTSAFGEPVGSARMVCTEVDAHETFPPAQPSFTTTMFGTFVSST
jgi:hypothetical protein